MGAITYRLELDAERHPTLVKENEVSCYDKPITEPAYIVELCDKLVRLRFLAEENARFDLMEEGILKGTGNIITVEDEKGEKKQMEEPEEIHTYQGWKSLNRQVKRGEKSIATIQIWKHTTTKSKEKDEEEQEKMFLTKAFFLYRSPDRSNCKIKKKWKLPQGASILTGGT